MTRRVLWKTTNGEHRTMIKKDYGIKREVVEELTAFPLGTYCIHNAFTSLLLRWLWVTDQRLTSLQSLTSQRNQEGQKSSYQVQIHKKKQVQDFRCEIVSQAFFIISLTNPIFTFLLIMRSNNFFLLSMAFQNKLNNN